MGNSDFAIIVSFTLEPGARTAFLNLVKENAAQSVATEAGCFRFDVLEPKGEDDQVLLYEIYTDRAAFDIHLASAHFKSFDAATKPMVRAKTVTVCGLSEYAK